MAITYPLTLPAGGFRNFSFTRRNATYRDESPFSFASDTQDWGGRAWSVSVETAPLSSAQGRAWEAFFSALKGPYGTFLMGDPCAATPAGSAGGTPLVAGGAQTGESLDIDGATISQTGWLLAGDFIQLGTGSSAELYQVVNDVDTNGSGAATIDIWPSLRTSPSNNASVIVTNTVGVFSLVDHQITRNSNNHYSVSFTAQEAL